MVIPSIVDEQDMGLTLCFASSMEKSGPETDSLGDFDTYTRAQLELEELFLADVNRCSTSTCCEHAACEPLKERALCRQWFCLRWESSSGAMPCKLLRVLQEQLGNSKFRYCAAFTDQEGIYDILLRFDRDGIPELILPRLVPQRSSVWFESSSCRAWSFDCCWDALLVDTQLWVRRLTDSKRSFIFGDKRLPHDLVNEARALGGTDGEI